MSFYSDYEKKKNKNKTSALLKVPQVVPQKPAHQDNSRRATAAHNREQQRVQAHQNAQRPASTYLTGGSTRLPYIDNYLASYTGFAFNLSDLYETSAAYGLEKIIRDRNLRKWAQPVKQKKL